MDNLYCTGEEKHLSHCHFEGWGLSDCDTSEAAGIICDPIGDTAISTIVPIKKLRRPIIVRKFNLY